MESVIVTTILVVIAAIISGSLGVCRSRLVL
jgi:hypothetical protein